MPDFSGQSIGRYHIIEPLGEGGMATVYKALDTRLEREVAVKIIRREAFSSEVVERMLQRFEREAKALSKLTHPNIVPIIDYGDDVGTPYLVMPFISGGTLKDLLTDKVIPVADASQFLVPVARALGYAHSNGILHRDVKPSNILITESGDPMLSDFGVAKIIKDDGGATLTGLGMGLGTPEYMAPEQWVGKASAASDQYSLAVVFYEMITGYRPYTAETPPAVMLKQASEPLPRPKIYNSGISSEAEKLLFKALAKKPEDRYVNMTDFARALENLTGGKKAGTFTVGWKKAISGNQVDSTDGQTMDTGVVDSQVNSDKELEPESKKQKRSIKWYWALVGSIGIFVILYFTIQFIEPGKQPSDIDNSNGDKKSIQTSQLDSSMLTKTYEVNVSNTPKNPSTSILDKYLIDVTEPIGKDFINNFSWENNPLDIRAASDSIDLLGKSTSPTQIKLSQKLINGEGILVDFMIDPGTYSEVFFENGGWETPTYKRFGIYPLSPLNTPGSDYRSGNATSIAPLGIVIKPSNLYTLFLGIGFEGDFTAVIWEKNNPSNITKFEKTPGSDWSGKFWDLKATVDSGKLTLSNFAVVNFSGYK